MKKAMKCFAILIASMTAVMSLSAISASASKYDSYTYFDELAGRVFFSSATVTRYEAMSINLGFASGSSANLIKYRISAYPTIKPNFTQTEYTFSSLNLSCKFDRSDSSTTTVTNTGSNRKNLPATTGSDIYSSLALTSGVHTLTVTYQGVTGGITMYSF